MGELGEAEGFAALWEVDAAEEDAHQLYRAQEEVQIAQDRLGAMERQLLDEQEKSEQFTFWYLALIALVILGVIGAYLGQQARKKQRARVIEQGLQAKGDELQNLPLEINRADIRVLGEAISQGRHIQDALLVMKKMSSMLDLASDESHPLKELPRIPGIASLTDRERQVLNTSHPASRRRKSPAPSTWFPSTSTPSAAGCAASSASPPPTCSKTGSPASGRSDRRPPVFSLGELRDELFGYSDGVRPPLLKPSRSG